MANPKIVDGKIKYKLRTFDGSYVDGQMFESEARVLLANAEQNGDVPGFELVSGPYRFESEEVVLKLGNKSKRKNTDET